MQVGAYEDRQQAQELVDRLKNDGFEAYLIFQNGLYKVQVGAFEMLSNAAAEENRIRDAG